MGQTFYLVREDNRTLFELGKHTGEWREWLGRGNAIVAVDGFEETLAGLLAIDIGLWTTHPDPKGDERYAIRVARLIVEWAGGQPFRFASEDECERERWDEAWPIAGTRYGAFEISV